MRVISGVILFIILCIDNGLSLSGSTSTSRPTDGRKTNTPKEEDEDNFDYYYLSAENFRFMETKYLHLTTDPTSPGHYLKNPLFVTAPSNIAVADDVEICTEISRVKAVDPDIRQQRKIFYYQLPDTTVDCNNQIFTVDKDTGVITTNERLDTGTIPNENVTNHMIKILAGFQLQHEFSDNLLYHHGEDGWSVVFVKVRALHRGLHNQLQEPRASALPVEESSLCFAKNNFIGLFILSGIVILVIVVVILKVIETTTGINKQKMKTKGMNSARPPKCVKVK